ncbi:hypothetical protein AB832_02245 [Flavobacteriaceae bacterium (ex Bugula neritina AB1)]|nr:hypothetical protein AB832_02245 [Flavobacteriaceae bacterium (ex Bugula neritina AB1)]
MVAYTKSKGSSLYNELLELYVAYGFYKENLVSLVKKGIEGAEEIKQTMIDLRNNPPTYLNKERIVLIEDYQKSISKNLLDHTEKIIDTPKSNVLIFYTESGSKIAARPSGTEPKIKFYISVQESLSSKEDYEKTQEQLNEKIRSIKQDLGLA